MGIRVKVDEDLPRVFSAMLCAEGHDALSVSDQGMTGARDEVLWPVVQRELRCLFTADKGFADIRSHAPGTHAGIVLFRLPFESRAGYVRLLEYFLRKFDLNESLGAVVVVTSDEIRVHRSSESERNRRA